MDETVSLIGQTEISGFLFMPHREAFKNLEDFGNWRCSRRRLQVGRIDRRRGWRGGDFVAKDKTFGLDNIFLDGKDNAQISWVRLFVFEIYTREQNFNLSFLAQSSEIRDILSHFFNQ